LLKDTKELSTSRRRPQLSIVTGRRPMLLSAVTPGKFPPAVMPGEFPPGVISGQFPSTVMPGKLPPAVMPGLTGHLNAVSR